MSPVFYAFSLTLLAGLSTAIGGLLGLVTNSTNRRFLAASLGLSAGVMIYVSLVELLAQGQDSLSEALGGKTGEWVAIAAFFVGILIAAIIDRLVPESINPHEMGTDTTELTGTQVDTKLMRAGLITALAVGLHNFPEGFATFMTALESPSLAIPVAFAIAIHNIPEGIAVVVPLYHSTGNRKRAFLVTLASGLAEPLGAIIGYALLRNFLGPATLGAILAGVAGIMVFISLDELLPMAEEYGEHHFAIYGLVAGMAVMAVSLVLLT